MKKIYSLLLALVFLLISSGCSKYSSSPITETYFCMDTYISITVYNKTDAEIIEHAFSLCNEYEEILSKTSDKGDIVRLENNRNKSIEVSEHTINVINVYKDLYAVSESMLDCTVGKLSNLWDFSKNSSEVPEKSDIIAAIDTISLDNLIIDENKVMLKSDFAALDFGAVAKGYISGLIKEYLIENGVESAILNFGGNVVIIGSKPDGSEFNVGIQTPFADGEQVITSISVKDKAVITAGVYERFIESNEETYHHILDPFTGYSVETDLLSATIICDDPALGDAYSTICILLGKDKALNLINGTDGFEAILVDENNEITLSNNASQYINKE